MPFDITIVGLGPGQVGAITREAWDVLSAASKVYLRTSRHPCVRDLPPGPSYYSFDEIYERHDDFDEVYNEIVERVLQLTEEGGVVYAVPGDPLVGETTVARLRERARAQDLALRIVNGVSFIGPTLLLLRCDAFDGLQIVDATLLAQEHHPRLDPDVAALVVQLYDRHLAADVKLTLMDLYPDDHPVKIVYHAALDDARVQGLELYELDRQDDLDHLTSAYLPPLAQRGGVASYQNVVATLRAPGGCPWDREQTHKSLRTSLLEETYEVLEALDAEDSEKLCEELGDLLLQIIFHAQIAAEDGEFLLTDSVQMAIEKLVRRHPHVFADAEVADADDVLRNWEQIKREERGDAAISMLSGVNKALPALSQAMEIQRRVARVGFDWSDADGVCEKVLEELQEFLQAKDDEARAAEFGDLLFSLVNLARWQGIDAESVLREASQRFARRFAVVEREAAARGVALEEMPLDEMERIWQEAKAFD